MDVLLLVVLCGGLCYASSESSLEPLTDHVVVLKVPHKVRTEDHVPLVCRNDNQTQAVFWKKDGVELKPPLQGNQVTVVVEEVDGGNYSCHSSDGQYLNHTVIFVHVETEKVILREISPEEGYIQCSVPNYSGPFRCSWSRTASRSNAAVLLLNATRNGREIPCELDADGSGIQCEEDNCPYKEEQHRIFLTTHIRRYYRLETYTKAFYIKDIVRPGALSNLQRSGANVFSWSYPDSWEKPCSFYGLNFQVKVVRHAQSCDSEAPILGNNTDDTKFEVNVKTKKYVFCVRAQDRYTEGPFGPWSNCVVNKDDVSC
uniref:Interleukin-12 subunit beta n=1 Tax=Tetraodon nigroviridis TaxID=99883 RepID=Q6UAP2_TETNG|nr:class I helical cytokine receptor member 14 [Tetraodon nigroviridis]